jgi:hypothetical protein
MIKRPLASSSCQINQRRSPFLFRVATVTVREENESARPGQSGERAAILAKKYN